jgi:hypothetical protein
MTNWHLRGGAMSNINIWELEEKIRSQLASGVRFEGDDVRGPRLVAATVGLNWFAWVKLDEKTNELTVVYIRGATMVTVKAKVRNKKDVEIVGVSLDSICGCRCNCGGHVHV